MNLLCRGGACILLVLLAACTTPEPPPLPPRPNILLISIDTLRADHLSIYGYERETAPALAELAAESIVFERAYSHSPKTGPSHMTVMTGLLPEAHGVMNLSDDRTNRALSSDIATLAEILFDAGYATRAYTNGGHLVPSLGFKRGFQVFRTSNHRQFQWTNKFMRERPQDRPFFLFVHSYGPHDPYAPPEEYQTFVSADYDGEIESSYTALKALGGKKWHGRHNAYWDRVDPERPGDVQHLRDLYDGSILQTEAKVARVLEHLELLELVDDTLVIVMSDHGEEFYEHGGNVHETLYEEQLRVPLVMRFPGEDGRRWAGRRVSEVGRLVDVLPTILDYLELPLPEVVQGSSLLPLIEGEPGETREVFGNYPVARHFSLMRGDWKIIRRPNGREELYNLAEDRGETKNLMSSNPAEAERMRRELARISGANRALLEHFQQGEETEIPEALRDDLEALGYLGGGN